MLHHAAAKKVKLLGQRNWPRVCSCSRDEEGEAIFKNWTFHEGCQTNLNFRLGSKARIKGTVGMHQCHDK